MTFFSQKPAYLGVDLGTSTAKIVELARKGDVIELVTYAEASVGNMLVNPSGDEKEAIADTIALLKQMIEKSESTAKNVIAALPGGSVFSTVLMLPNISEEEMEKAVKFAARDVVPADIDEMVIGWSRVGSQAHMQTDRKDKTGDEAEPKKIVVQEEGVKKVNMDKQVPVFVTAAPKDIVNRYIAVFQ
ncbi:MAG: pilus assembly protein PilM, partial [Candidatus Andersenbacteria bacterium]